MPQNHQAITLPPITDKQKDILFLLYKFRFLNTNQIQKLLNHKLPTRIQPWLKDLEDKGYVSKNYERLIFAENTKPAIYYLASRARHILKHIEDANELELNRIYNEKRREENFINHCIFIADIYLVFMHTKTSDEELSFYTRSQLRNLDYFPSPLPDAYIVVEEGKDTKRYFLDYLEEYMNHHVFKNRIKTYLQFVEERVWEESTNDTESPTILIVCTNEKMRKHLYYYFRSFIENSYEDLEVYLTTKDIILKEDGQNEVWKEVK